MVRKNLCKHLDLGSWTKSHNPSARVFTEPSCHNEAKCWYIVYRWLLFFCWASIIICSIFEFGTYDQFPQSEKWLIYLTNWDLMLGFTQSLLGAILVTHRWRLQRRPNFDAEQIRLGKVERAYWFLYVSISSLAVGVTVIYWLSVYDPEIHNVDPGNILVHVCNSALMLADVSVSKVPFRMRNLWWNTILVVLYVVFSVAYYFAGGTDYMGRKYIYKVLDWAKPQTALMIAAGGLCLTLFVHCTFCVLLWLRNLLVDKCAANRARNKHNDTQSTVTDLVV